MKLILTRHGETDWNNDNRVLGRTDIPLNETGIKQAEELEKLLNCYSFDIILTSPLSRAFKTGQIVGESQDCHVKTRKELLEQNFGIFEGVDRGNSEYQQEKRKFFTRYPEGESILDVAGRVVPLINELKQKDYKTVLIVAHGGICRVITAMFEAMDNEQFASFSLKNCEVKEFEL